jgi:LmbE family N-acetylglucosaminyl deacetylase
MRNWREELTGRVLVLVAHPDDESVAYGALLQKMRQAAVVIVTDGAPRDPYFWQPYGSRLAYSALRRQEAQAAMQLAGAELVLLSEADERLEDQRLFLHLSEAEVLLDAVAARLHPQAIATLAYEGGHPDHDSCSLLAARLGQRLSVPVWETPVYHRSRGEHQPCLQSFVCENGSECEVEISPDELERKRRMCAQYASQGRLLDTFDPRRELVRPQVRYDYAQPPHTGPVNYECWQWWMKAREVSARFAEFVAGTSQ